MLMKRGDRFFMVLLRCWGSGVQQVIFGDEPFPASGVCCVLQALDFVVRQRLSSTSSLLGRESARPPATGLCEKEVVFEGVDAHGLVQLAVAPHAFLQALKSFLLSWERYTAIEQQLFQPLLLRMRSLVFLVLSSHFQGERPELGKLFGSVALDPRHPGTMFDHEGFVLGAHDLSQDQ
jgi:hypothetical protein